MNETQLTITGNLVDDPELRFTPSGQAVARFRIASTPRYREAGSGEWKDGDPLFLTCVAWRQLAENTAETLHRGARAIVTGRLRQRSYEAQDGSKRTVYEVECDEIGASLLRATAKITKATRTSTGNGGRGQDAAADSGSDTDPWASEPASDEPPF
jgi:single-strand DNA-binding protein